MPKKAKAISLITFGIILGSTAVGFAAIPDSNNVITACYSTGLLGKVRIIDAATTPNCNAGETKITWNQKGQKGDTGAQGPAGSTSPASAQTAFAKFNVNGTLDTSFSKNIDNYDVRTFTDSGVDYRYTCFKVHFDPKSVLTRDGDRDGGVGTQLALRGLPSLPGDTVNIDNLCGSEFNAVDFGEEPNADPTIGYERAVYTFFN